jgi:antitoxin VapB
MGLNIKNQETIRLAEELCDLTGEGKTEAITEALRERLEREKAQRDKVARAARLLGIGRRCAAHLKGEPIPHGELLYDERGLPK